MLRPSLVSLDSKMRAYKTIFLPQINYAQKAIWNNNEKGNEFTTK